jgi:hypothetical protein
MRLHTLTIHQLYREACQADDAWQLELRRQFRWNAGDVRYTKEGEGAEGSLLNELYCAFRVSTDAWLKAVSDARKENTL